MTLWVTIVLSYLLAATILLETAYKQIRLFISATMDKLN